MNNPCSSKSKRFTGSFLDAFQASTAAGILGNTQKMLKNYDDVKYLKQRYEKR